MADTIRDFLVSLGYTVKSNEERNFTDSLARSKVAAVAFGATLTGLVATIAKVASAYEALYYQSQRVQASVGNIQAFAYGLSQVGGSATSAKAALENMGNFLRSSPGSEGFFARLGIQTRDARGGLRDTTEILRDFAQTLKTMPTYRAQAYAGVLGIDPVTLQAMMRDTGVFSAQIKGMYAAAGVNAEQAARGSAVFMQQLRGLGAALQVLRDKVALSLERGVGGMIDRLRRMLVDNFARISTVIVSVTKFIIGLGWALMQLVGRAADLIGQLIDWFDHLDRGSKKWIETLGLVLLAWRILNAGILATPLGMGLAAILGLGLLLDDYKAWKEGSKHLIDWDKWKPDIDAALDAINTIRGDLSDLWPHVQPFLSPLLDFWKKDLIAAVRIAGGIIAEQVLGFDALTHGRFKEYLQHVKNIAGLVAEGAREGAGNVATLAGQENTASGGALGRFADRMLNSESGYTSDYEGTRGMRNNNPLNLSYLPGQGAIGSDGRFGRYSSLSDGIAATTRQLLAYRKRGIDTVSSIIKKWAPESENGSDDTYINQVAGWSGLDRNAPIDVRDPNIAQRLISAMGRHESGLRGHFGDVRNGVYAGLGMTGFDARVTSSIGADNQRYGRPDPALGGLGLGRNGPHVNQNNTFHISGAQSPDAVGKSVLRHQDVAMESIVRNMGPLSR